jgi:hypothetical protein
LPPGCTARFALTLRWTTLGNKENGGLQAVLEPPVRMERATGIEPATSSLGISSRSPNFMSLAIRTHHLRPSFGPPDLTHCHSFSRHLGIILGSGRWAPRQPESLPWNVTAKPGCRSRPGSSVCIPIRPIGVQPLLCQGPAVSTAAWGSPLSAVVSEPRAHLQGGCSLLRPPLSRRVANQPRQEAPFIGDAPCCSLSARWPDITPAVWPSRDGSVMKVR